MKIYEYVEEYGEIKYPEGFYDEIRKLGIDEQMNYFRIAGSTRFENTFWPDRTTEYTRSLEDCSDVQGLIVKDGCIAGVMINNWRGADVAVLPEMGVCTYWASDNNGAGSKDREDYAYLICVRP